MTNLPQTNESYNTILTITDRLIKRTYLVPCQMGDKELSVIQVADHFFKHFVCKFGVTEEIINDRDSRFVLTIWQHL